MTQNSPHDISTLSFTEVSTIPLFDKIKDGDLFMIALSNNTTRLTHGLHRFPAKYIPQWTTRLTISHVCRRPVFGGPAGRQSIRRNRLGSLAYVAPLFGPDTLPVIQEQLVSTAGRFFSPNVVTEIIEPTVLDIVRGAPPRRTYRPV